MPSRRPSLVDATSPRTIWQRATKLLFGRRVDIRYCDQPLNNMRSWFGFLTCPELQQVVVVGPEHGYRLARRTLNWLRNARTLSWIRVSLESIRPTSVPSFARLRRLHIADLTNDEGVLGEIIDKSPYLRDLSVSNMWVSDNLLERIVAKQSLRNLDIQACRFNDERWLSRVAARCHLRRFVVCDSTFFDGDLAELGRMRTLRHLHVQAHAGCSSLETTTIASWQPLARLVYLGLSFPRMDRESQLSITRIRSLKRLDVVTDDVPTSVVEAIAQMPRLRQCGIYPRRGYDETRRQLSSIRPELDVR